MYSSPATTVPSWSNTAMRIRSPVVTSNAAPPGTLAKTASNSPGAAASFSIVRCEAAPTEISTVKRSLGRTAAVPSEYCTKPFTTKLDALAFRLVSTSTMTTVAFTSAAVKRRSTMVDSLETGSVTVTRIRSFELATTAFGSAGLKKVAVYRPGPSSPVALVAAAPVVTFSTMTERPFGAACVLSR